MLRKHSVSTAGALPCRPDRGRRFSCFPHAGDDLPEVLDPLRGESRHAILADAMDMQSSVLGEHVDREFVEPVLVFAEQSGNVADGEDVGDGRHGQAAWRRAA